MAEVHFLGVPEAIQTLDREGHVFARADQVHVDAWRAQMRKHAREEGRSIRTGVNEHGAVWAVYLNWEPTPEQVARMDSYLKGGV